MKIEFIVTKKRIDAVREMPWAIKIVKVVDGYIGFESWADYYVWNNQK